MMIGSGVLKSTPAKAAPTWNTAPPATTPGELVCQAELAADQVMRNLL
jgi:hypothetical protein